MDRDYQPEKEKFQIWGGLVCIISPYWPLARFMIQIFLGWGYTFWDAIPYFVFGILLCYFFWVGPLRSRERAQARAAEVDLYDSIILKHKKIPEQLMLGFKEYWECDLNFDSSNELSIRLKSRMYQYYLYRLTLDQISDLEDNQRDIPEALEKHVEKLEKMLEEINKLTLKQKESQVNQKKLIEISKKFENDTRDILSLYKIDILPFKEFDLEEIKSDEKFKQDLEILKQLKCFYVRLYAKEHFKDEKEEWEELFILTLGEYSEVLKTHNDKVPISGWYVNGNVCYCTWAYLWGVTNILPVLLLKSSQNTDAFGLDKLSTIGVKAAAFLQLKVMNIWMNDLEIKPEKILKDNEMLKTKARTFEEGFGYHLKDLADMDLKYANFYKNKVQQELISRIEKYKRKQYILLSVLILIVIVGAITIGFLL